MSEERTEERNMPQMFVFLSAETSDQQNTKPFYDKYPTNIGIIRGTVSVATIVVVSAGVDISVAIRFLYHLCSARVPAQALV